MAELAINGGPRAVDVDRPVWPILTEADEQEVLSALRSGHWCRIYSESRVERFEQEYAAWHDAKHAVAVANGTVSLELALRAGGVRPGDEVIVTAVTFIASASAIVMVGAVPVFVDIDPETAVIDAAAVEAAVTARTTAVVAVHYGGYPVDFDALQPVCARHGLLLVEDCAHAHGTAWCGRRVGAIGDFGSFSFQESKSLASGEGGIVLTDDDQLAEKARLLHNIGRVVGKPGYAHLVLASNYRMTELQGALLHAQWQRLAAQTAVKQENGRYLADEIEKLGGICALKRDERITDRGYYFLILRYDAAAHQGISRDRFQRALAAEGVPCGAGYAIPLYRQEAFRRDQVAMFLPPDRLGPLPDYESLHLPNAERFCSDEQLTLPHQLLLLPRAAIERIIGAFAKVKENLSEVPDL